MNESAHSISYSNRTIRASFEIKYSETFSMKKHIFEAFFCVYKMKNTLLKRISCLKNEKDVFEAFCMLKMEIYALDVYKMENYVFGAFYL